MTVEKPTWLTVLETCESTNTWALQRLSQLQHGDVVFTRNQTAGRGQFDRTWVSLPGTLTASFVLDLSAAQLSGFSLIAGLAVIDAIETLSPDLRGRLRLKWTNDVFVDDRKLAGILCESRIRGEKAQVIVGIGLNRETVPSIGNPISLRQISDQVPHEQALLEQLRSCLLRLCDRPFAELLPEIQVRDALFGRAIVFESAGEKLAGAAAGIDPEGQLLIRLADGIRAYRSGRVLSIE
ncbi:MAG TPA: biotin--[acetyl-CoA-carboxylase] ligase [Leptolyngbya sp.]|jgi:BirA family biotin operon repressor/biotin-[acetyl-CoA-carboxylase] ligase|nr:biotin--[acetyl-CoA-carboxylase] ligase [Leptolyngbya sp.]